MARALRYSPMIGIMLLVLGFVLGGAGAWTLAPSIFGASKPKTPGTAPAVKKPVAPAEVARTVALVDQAVAPQPKKVEPAVQPKAPDVVAPPDAAAAPDAGAAPVPPEQEVSLPEYTRLERPFALRCPSVLNRYDRAGAKLDPITVEPFCAGLRGRFTIVLFWRSDSEPALAALKLFQENAARLQKATPPVQIVFVSADRFLSDLKAFYEAEGASWTFETYQALVDGWLTNYGSANPDRSFPWLLLTDPDRMVIFEGHAMLTPPELKGFEKFLAATAAARPESAKADDAKAADVASAAAKAAETPRQSKAVDAASKKSAPAAGAVAAGRREIDYVTLGLQVMRLFPELAGTPELRQVVKAAEGSLNAKLKKMSPGEANRLAANLPDSLVRDAVKAALKSLGK